MLVNVRFDSRVVKIDNKVASQADSIVKEQGVVALRRFTLRPRKSKNAE